MKGKSSTRVTSSPPTISNWVLQHTPSSSSSHSRPLSLEASLGHSGEKRGKASSFASSCKNRGQFTLCLHCHPSSHSPAPKERSLVEHFAGYSRPTCNDPSKKGADQSKEENHSTAFGRQLHEERSHCFPSSSLQTTGWFPSHSLPELLCTDELVLVRRQNQNWHTSSSSKSCCVAGRQST